ncbi:hypothetical protein L195_g061798, partial [Trifolium pratense]
GWLLQLFVNLDGFMVLWMSWKGLRVQLNPSKLYSLMPRTNKNKVMLSKFG